ncbi:hypothetical protein ACQ86N_02185 [Puia sp. P3]|uniref:hypothetical protein n=1 Tax=Puia sp. P3 TaxID=3423952 RepID=UPI003D66EC4A
MEINKILTADILDIIFEGKNKEYGAYELRKTYNKRTGQGDCRHGCGSFVAVHCFFVSNLNTGKEKKQLVVQDVQLEDVKEEKKNEPPPPPPPKWSLPRWKWRNLRLLRS